MQGLMQDVPLTLSLIFHRAEQLWPTKQLVTATTTGKVRTTYGDWAGRVRRLAGALDDLGVSEAGRVGTFAWNTANHLEVYYAAPCSGRVLHTLNPRLFAEQITYIANHAEDEVVFVDRSLVPTLWPLVDQLTTVRAYVVFDDDPAVELPDDPRLVGYEELLAAASPASVDRVTDEGRAAAMCYTSGTTGNPKGVVYSHRSQVLHAMATLAVDCLGVRESDVVLPVVPMFHANSWGLCQSGPLAGASFVFPGRDLSPTAVADLIVDEGVTLAAGVPTVWLAAVPALEGRDTSRLRAVLCGGSAVPRALAETYRTRFGTTITQAWGMTETSPIATSAFVRSEHAEADEEVKADLRATQGLPVPLLEVRIAEPDTGDVLPWDGKVTGEVQVRAAWAARSYYDDDRSAESFTADGWLRTGDVASIAPDGYVRLVDRTKDLIKSGGEWISSVELENELMAHPKIREAAVVGVAHERWQERPLACVVPEPGQSLTEGEVLDFLAPKVARWWLPDRVVFIDEVPRTSVGKFSKKTLRDRFADVLVSPTSEGE
ncbi:MAG TPA: long-chain fatty acid--CoA ligase [Acidimicrobiales bacterium]|nr:long-chain fatty acid--CoA ligase [Acidimicrobiales bacterium]